MEGSERVVDNIVFQAKFVWVSKTIYHESYPDIIAEYSQNKPIK